MKNITETPFKDLNYQRILISNPITDYYLKSKSLEIDINPPNICPLCGSKKIAGSIKIGSIYITPPQSVKILVCKDHLKLKKSSGNFPLVALSILIPFVFFIIFNYFIGNVLLGVIWLFIGMFSIFSWIGYGLIRNKIKNRMIRNYIFLESFQEGSVISVKHNDWVEEFKKDNLSNAINTNLEEDLRVLEELELKYRQIQTLLIVLGVITFVGMLISLFLSGLLYSIYAAIMQILTIIFLISYSFLLIMSGIIYIYLINYKIKRGKSEIYFKLPFCLE